LYFIQIYLFSCLGGHINPAVSLFFFTFGKLPLTRLLLYILVQTIGAFIGAAITFFVYFDAIRAFDGGNRTIFGVNATAGIFASYPAAHLGWFNGLVDQVRMRFDN
jgi:glycerol uptake facilitator-like aquaporin